MKIDTSFLKKPQVVIHCKTKEEANMLLEAVLSVHPELEEQLLHKVRCFNLYADQEGLGYRFTRVSDGYDIGYSGIDFYREFCYNITAFSDISSIDDYGCFESGFADNTEAIQAIF